MDGYVIQIRKHGTPLARWAIITIGYGPLWDLDKEPAQGRTTFAKTWIFSFGLKLPWKREYYDMATDGLVMGSGWLCWLQRRGWFLTGTRCL